MTTPVHDGLDRFESIAIFGANAFAVDLPLGDVQLARAFTRVTGLRVVFVDPPRRHPVKVGRGAEPRPDDPEIISPSLPSGRSIVRSMGLADRMVARQVQRSLGDNLARSLAVVTDAKWGPLTHLPFGAVVYWQRDLHSAHGESVPPTRVLKRHRRLLVESDLVTAVSSSIRDANLVDRQEVSVIGNGVDLGHWVPEADEPEELRAIPRPRAVFSGGWSWRVDSAMLQRVATRCPDVSFLVIGNDQDVEATTVENLHFLGRRSYASLPAYLQACDIGLIPYTNNDFNSASSPLKLIEYLASGLPVLAANVEVPVHPRVMRDDSEAEWPKQLRRLISLGRNEQDGNFLAANSWDSRVRTLASLLTTAQTSEGQK